FLKLTPHHQKTDGFFAAVPGVEGDFGISEDWPFPGIFFTHPERGTVLMAVLSQERCKPYWHIRSSGKKTSLQAAEYFSGVPSIKVKGEQEIETEHWVMLSTPGSLEDAVEEYYRLLRKKISFHGENSVLREAIVWGSWNYNYRPRSFCDITHKMIADNAQALAKLVPDKPKVVIIDDGYQRGLSRHNTMDNWFASCLDIFYNDGMPPHDPELFPKGMKGVADAIKKAGVIPAIWTTPRIFSQSALAKARPEWILQLDGGKSFGARSVYLDYSLPEVREFTRKAWRTIYQTWGYQGIKMDFWSIPFEVPQVRFRNRDMTAVELRNLFLQDIRECVPKNGFLLIAVVCNGGGNPFVGRYVDGVRMGMDIGNGTCSDVQQSAVCLTTASPFYRHDCLLGDPDAIGWCPKNTPGQNRLWATMAILSGAICEIGGDLTSLSPEARNLLQTATRHFGPSHRTLNGISSGNINNLPSGHLILEREDGVYEAYLNWMLWPREITLKHPVRDLWTGETLSGKHKIPPQDAIWFKR
ncbi:MAG: alpha-galactosidase, partial [Lentisphaerota bacterium]